MTVSAGSTDRTNLLVENGNLIAAMVANPDLLRTVLNEIYDYLDANWNDYNSHKNGAVLGHPDGSVTTAKIAVAAITNALLAINSVASSNIQAGAVNNTHLANDSVGAAQLQTDSVGNAELQDNSVGTSNIQDYAVSATKIDPAIMNGNVQLGTHRLASVIDHPDGSVTLAKLDPAIIQSLRIRNYMGV